MATTRRAQRRGIKRRTNQRGATLVEAALVMPIFIMLVLGIFEFGFYFKDVVLVRNAAQNAAREASASGQDAFADFGILQAIDRFTRTVDGSLDFVIVFKSRGVNDAVPAACLQSARTTLDGGFKSGQTLCNIYRPTDIAALHGNPTIFHNSFGWDAATRPTGRDAFYPALARKDFVDGPPDNVGIYIQVTHRTFTSLLTSQVKITRTIALPIEARRTGGA